MSLLLSENLTRIVRISTKTSIHKPFAACSMHAYALLLADQADNLRATLGEGCLQVRVSAHIASLLAEVLIMR